MDPRGSDMKPRNSFPAVGVEFQNISFSAGSIQGGRNTILKSLSGRFRPGELTAILGPSGAGKSSLLNVLVGLMSTGVSGSITNNGHPRDRKLFHKLSTYIMQDDHLLSRLSVEESMEFAANIKLGQKVSAEMRQATITEILGTLGLEGTRETRTEKLSGGQRKRLCVALELVNNPPVIFLDEPTSGLDVVSVNHCISALKRLASQGRTVICTMHQPSATLFHQMDQVYLIARGCCVYQGFPRHLVPFLASLGINCPRSYNPADFVMDVVQEGNMIENIKAMSTKIRNGELTFRGAEPGALEYALHTDIAPEERLSSMFKASTDDGPSVDFASSSTYQFWLLLGRMYKRMKRNKLSLWVNGMHHVAIAIFLSLMFRGTGADGNEMFDNFKLYLCLNVFFLYCPMIGPALVYPVELHSLKKEYLNRWYGLKPYVMALFVSTIPVQIMMAAPFNTIVYAMVGYPFELHRVLLFNLAGILCTLTSEGLGLLIGSIFNQVNAAVIGAITFAPLVTLCMSGIGLNMLDDPVRYYARNLSYIYHVMASYLLTTFGLDRERLDCDLDRFVYCHFKDPELLVEGMGMKGLSIVWPLSAVAGFLVLHRLLFYMALRVQLTLELQSKLNHLVRMVLRRK